MAKDDAFLIPKELIIQAAVFFGSVIASIATFLFNAETWVTFATAMGGILSLARAIQIIINLYSATKKPTLEEQAAKTKAAFRDYIEEQEKTERLITKAEKEAALLASGQVKARRYPPVKPTDKT